MKTAQWNAFQKCTVMLEVNQPIRVQPEVMGGGGKGRAWCSAAKPKWKYSTTCTRRVQ